MSSSKIHIVNAVFGKGVFLDTKGVKTKIGQIPVYPILMQLLHDADTLKPRDVLSIYAMGCH